MTIKDRIEKSYRVRDGYWFAPKRFGMGAVPVTWQGWLATIIYVALLFACVRLLPGIAAKLAVGVPLTIGFMVIAARKTDGGWHWRWGFKK
ncbi:hypothetical protein [Stakelama marina]|uniref:Uncharacterized protein n=1 Tax=Stakelama marina TaxID=2826939 RepID=A0A8T4IIY5_9SPHN|nr:hypothetical protein [Stakelama marina]MBR0552269.1 hypothetical protein [Stakelama marina]